MSRQFSSYQNEWLGTPAGLVATAVCEFKAGRCDGIKFELFNMAEVEEVRSLMKAHPEIPFHCTWIEFPWAAKT